MNQFYGRNDRIFFGTKIYLTIFCKNDSYLPHLFTIVTLCWNHSKRLNLACDEFCSVEFFLLYYISLYPCFFSFNFGRFVFRSFLNLFFFDLPPCFPPFSLASLSSSFLRSDISLWVSFDQFHSRFSLAWRWGDGCLRGWGGRWNVSSFFVGNRRSVGLHLKHGSGWLHPQWSVHLA